MSSKFRRPAQLSEELMETIPGDHDVAYNAELANTSAWALVPVDSTFEDSQEVRQRIIDLVHSEGIDVIAESWVRSPEESLAGMLWRGYLLYEWLRRYPAEVTSRLKAARVALEKQGADGAQKIAMLPDVEKLQGEWAKVFAGEWDGPITDVLRDSARFTNVVGEVGPEWIDEDDHPLATGVTRRDNALIHTSEEFREGASRAERGTLN